MKLIYGAVLMSVLLLTNQPALAEQKTVADDALPWLTGQEVVAEPATEATKESTKPVLLEHDPVMVKLVFVPEDTAISSVHTASLKSKLLVVKQPKDARFILKSYASKRGGRESSARRSALSRALSVRSYLVEEGYQKSNISVQILIAGPTDRPKDRIDVEELR